MLHAIKHAFPLVLHPEHAKESTMIDKPDSETAPDNRGTALGFDAAPSRARAAGDWQARLIRLLEMAFRDVDADRADAKASIAQALLLLQAQIGRSPFDPAHSSEAQATPPVERDLSDHALAHETLREAQAELAHAERIAMMGRLIASVAHEVEQPIAAMILSAQAARRFLDQRPPDLHEVRQ